MTDPIRLQRQLHAAHRRGAHMESTGDRDVISTQQWQRDRGIATYRTEVKWFAVDLYITTQTIRRSIEPVMRQLTDAFAGLAAAFRDFQQEAP